MKKEKVKKVGGKLVEASPSKPPRDYSLIKDIREEKLYKSNIVKRDTAVRKWVDNNIDTKNKGEIMPGQLIMFNYLEPKTKEELEYYDQLPCTIFFSEFNTKDGEPRVLGFNLHYYPPKIRYMVADRIFSIFKPIYEQSWNSPLNRPMSFMQYKMLLEQLETMSTVDMLTDVYNRNAMNNKVSDFVTSSDDNAEPFGIVFTDLNGLKRVNDSDGHFAGDLLLKKAAILLQEVFSGDEIFRAGGDEFMMIVSGSTEQEFEKKIQTLRDKANDPENVCFAIGSCYDANGRDIRRAMHIADEQMYKDKENYYKLHPERKHR